MNSKPAKGAVVLAICPGRLRGVFIAEQPYGQGFGFTKKKAEQDASEKTCLMLNI